MHIKIEKRLAEIRLEALRRQLNPHFTFNAINSLQYFILKNETEAALGHLGKLANLIRNTLDISARQVITLAEEIAYLKDYAYIENARINHRVNINITAERTLDLETIQIPPMLIHPFIENAFIHAFSGAQLKPSLDIYFQLDSPKLLTCQIKDNGKGFDTSGISVGIDLVVERLIIWFSSNKKPVEVNSERMKGTSVKLFIQLQKD